MTFGNRDGHANYPKEWTGASHFRLNDEVSCTEPAYAEKGGALVITSAQERKFLVAVADKVVCKDDDGHLPATPEITPFGAFGAHARAPPDDTMKIAARKRASHFALNSALFKQNVGLDVINKRYVQHCPRLLVISAVTGGCLDPLAQRCVCACRAGGCDTPLRENPPPCDPARLASRTLTTTGWFHIDSMSSTGTSGPQNRVSCPSGNAGRTLTPKTGPSSSPTLAAC